MRHFISIAEADRAWLDDVFDTAFKLRGQRRAGQANDPVLRGKTLAMIFEKPSLRTRVSFEQAMIELGGHAIVLDHQHVGLGDRESVPDVARVLGGMVHGIAARVFDHDKLTQLAQHAGVPVINALSDYSHPCQAMADAMTMMDEFGRSLKGRTLAFVGDGNNVARSLATICGKLDINFVLASPPGYELEQQFIDRIMSQVPTMNFEQTHDAVAAVRYADVIYTDTWISMGQEDEARKRIEAFKDYCVNANLLRHAPKHAIVLHCLPAHRGYEIDDATMDGPRSRVFPEAHNRLHAQKALLVKLMG
jgi:ornithine carbamoyltransferase